MHSTPGTLARRARWVGRAIGLTTLFAALVAFRVATANITNDDYLHLSTAQQVVLGAVPVRDFLDPGELLFYGTSAAAQVLGGRSLLSEVLLDSVLLSVGHVVVFVLATRAARSAVVGLLATAFPVLIVSRLYSYPKTLLYAVALLLIWRYLDRRSTRLLWALSTWTGLSFLFRHDHGAYIGLTASVMLLIAHGQDRRALMRALAHFAAPLLLVVVPFLVFLQLNGGVAFYLRQTLDTARGEYARTVGPFPWFVLNWNGLWPALVPPPPGEPDVNLTAWHYYVTVAMAPLTVLLLAADWARRRVGQRGDETGHWTGMPRETAKLTCAAVMGVLMHTYLLRAKSDSAIADVSALTAVLGAWLIARGLSASWHGLRQLWTVGPRRAWLGAVTRLIAAAVSVTVYVVTMQLVGKTPGGLEARSFARIMIDGGRNPVAERTEYLARMTAPYDDAGARYLHACLADTDRLLISSGYRPELYYAAGRGFAAGRLYYLASLAPAPEFKAFSLARLSAERVPIALLNPEDDEFMREFPGLYGYVQRHYRPAGQLMFGNDEFQVLVDGRLAPKATAANGLPCFQ